jgi:hypothetical protein
MKHTYVVPLVNSVDKLGNPLTHLGVIVEHERLSPTRTGIWMSVLPVALNTGGSQMQWVITSGERQFLEQKVRKNQKAIDDWVHAIGMQIGLRVGSQWDFIVATAAKEGVTIAPVPGDETAAAETFEKVAS